MTNAKAMSSSPAAAPATLTAHNGKIGVLERRIQFLKRKIEKNVNYYAESESADFDRAEIEALEGAIAALEYHRDHAH